MAKKDTKRGKSGLISINENVAVNKRARFEYHLEDTFEAGIVLTGTEVKSLRHGRASIQESYVSDEGGEIYLINGNIPEYGPAGAHLQHYPTRKRKLLLNRREVHKIIGAINRQGMTVIPLRLYFNKTGLAKLEIALAKGKKLHDKRDTQKDRDWNRQKGRILRDKG